MFRKIIALFVLAVFAIINFSCGTYNYEIVTTKEKVETVLSWKKSKIEKAEILEVIKKSGESIDFSKQQPGKFKEGYIKSSMSRRVQIEINRSDIESTFEVSQTKTLSVTTRDGHRYVLYEPKYSEDKISGTILKKVDAIPLSEVEAVWLQLKEFRGDRVFPGILLGYGVLWFVLGVVSLIVSL